MNSVERFGIPDEAIIFTDLDECIIGLTTEDRVVYSYDKLIAHYVKEFGDSENPEEEALEWVSYNTIGAKVENGPIIMYEGLL